MELITIVARVNRTGNKRRPKYALGAEHAIDVIAAKKRMSFDELTDHFVPTCNADLAGGVTLDLGDWTWRVTFDPQLARILTDDSGDPVKALPRPGTKPGIDPAKLEAAMTLLADLDEDVAAIADLRAASLERAMVDGRSWSFHGDLEATGAYSQAGVFSSRPGPNDFSSVWVNHPLMKHMARGVLWEARPREREGSALVQFRIAEDGSFASVDDDPLVLPPTTAAVGVAHPLRLDRATRERWRRIFADYEVLQPFDQLAREPPALTEEELAGAELSRPATPDVMTHAERLVQIGWERRSRWGNFALPLPDDVYGVIRYDASAKSLKAYAMRDRQPVSIAELDDLARSELVRGLDLLTAS